MTTEAFPNSEWLEFVSEPFGDNSFRRYWKQKRTEPRIDHERAKRQGSLRGDPLVAPPGSNYPAGAVIDYFCLACGSTFAAHDEESDCWRVLKSAEELAEYDRCKAICNRIEYGSTKRGAK